MKRATSEWVKKAEGDWRVAEREIQEANPVWDAVCFHAQQCAEKYLKAFLEEHNVAFRKSHDLVGLLASGGGLLPELGPLKPQLAHLSTFGIATRYPGAQADRRAAEDAMATAEEVRTVVRAKLGLP